jgi:predicted DNA-binding antitoxin AbrB/MazE fold protein
MFNTIRAIVKEGRIELKEPLDLPEGTEVVVTIPSDDSDFWTKASQQSLSAVWENEADDVYGQLLKR